MCSSGGGGGEKRGGWGRAGGRRGSVRRGADGRPVVIIATLMCLAGSSSGIPISMPPQRDQLAGGGSSGWHHGGLVDPHIPPSNETTTPPPAARPVFDHEMAVYLLNHSRTTYCEDENIGNWTCGLCKTPSLRAFRPYFVTEENKRHVFAYVGYAQDRDMAIVVFRGTTFLANWIQDLEYYKMDSKYGECGKQKGFLSPGGDAIGGVASTPGSRKLNETPRAGGEDGIEMGEDIKTRCMVHSGFYDDWLFVRDDVLLSVQKVLDDHPTAKTWVTGHSLGGALAAFAALEISLMLQSKDIGMYSFGEPRIGNRFFAEFWGGWVPNGIRVVHGDDLVPHLPPRGQSILLLTDFHHTTTEVWQSGPKDDEYVVCDDSGEDPACSGSLDYWDRSIEAHLLYMGLFVPGCFA